MTVFITTVEKSCGKIMWMFITTVEKSCGKTSEFAKTGCNW